jgi:hypothetical protein
MLAALGGALVAAAEAKSNTGVTAATAALIGATAALVAAIVAASASVLIQRRKERAEATRAQVDEITKQLGSLYGPLRLLTEQSRALADKLRENKPPDWHLLGHLSDVVDADADRALAEQIIAVNHKIEERIFANAGLLLDGKVLQSFVDFLGHHRSLSLAYEGVKSNRATTSDFTAKRFATYPRQFDLDVESSYEALLAERGNLLDQLKD